MGEEIAIMAFMIRNARMFFFHLSQRKPRMARTRTPFFKKKKKIKGNFLLSPDPRVLPPRFLFFLYKPQLGSLETPAPISILKNRRFRNPSPSPLCFSVARAKNYCIPQRELVRSILHKKILFPKPCFFSNFFFGVGKRHVLGTNLTKKLPMKKNATAFKEVEIETLGENPVGTNFFFRRFGESYGTVNEALTTTDQVMVWFLVFGFSRSLGRENTANILKEQTFGLGFPGDKVFNRNAESRSRDIRAN